MQIQSIYLNNFLSYEKASFEGLDEAGLILIEGRNLDEGGSNGAGKSSPWDAVSWCLFGQTMRGLKGDQVINRAHKKGCVVKVDLWFHEEGCYRVCRYRGHKTGGNGLYIETPDDSKIEFGTLLQTQEWLLKKLGIDFDLFRCTVLFAQGDTFNFVDAGNKQQKEILAKVMRLDYAKHLDRAKAVVSENTKLLSKYLSDIKTLDSHLVVDIEEAFAEDIGEWETSRKKKVSNYHNEIAGLKDELDGLKMPDGFKLKELDEAQDSLGAARDGFKRATSKFAEFKTMLRLKKQAFDESSLAPDKCTACGQAVDNSKAMDIAEKLAAEISTIEQDYIKAKRIADKYEAGVLAIQEKIDHFNTLQLKHEHFLDKSKRLQDSIASMKNAVKLILADENPHLAMRDQAIAKQKQIEAKIKEKRGQMKELEGKQDYLQFWATAFGDAGIKSFVFDLICSSLTNKANGYLNTLTNGSIAISFDTQKALKSGETREKFDCQILTDGERIDYAAYSGGEKRRISLAVDMALSDLMSDYYSSKFNVVVFDEQCSYLDEQGRRGFMRLVSNLARTKRVFVVDHDGEFKSKFDEVITIEKKDGISRVVC